MVERKSAMPRDDLLARAFLDILARKAGGSSKLLLRSEDFEDPVDLSADDEAARMLVRADLAAAAVLLARAIEHEPGLICELRCGCPVITIATHMPDLVSLVEEVIKTCAFG